MLYVPDIMLLCTGGAQGPLAFRAVLYNTMECTEQSHWRLFYKWVAVYRAVLVTLLSLLAPSTFMRPKRPICRLVAGTMHSASREQ